MSFQLYPQYQSQYDDQDWKIDAPPATPLQVVQGTQNAMGTNVTTQPAAPAGNNLISDYMKMTGQQAPDFAAREQARSGDRQALINALNESKMDKPVFDKDKEFASTMRDLGLRLLTAGGHTRNFGTALGEAGIGTLQEKKGREKEFKEDSEKYRTELRALATQIYMLNKDRFQTEDEAVKYSMDAAKAALEQKHQQHSEQHEDDVLAETKSYHGQYFADQKADRAQRASDAAADRSLREKTLNKPQLVPYRKSDQSVGVWDMSSGVPPTETVHPTPYFPAATSEVPVPFDAFSGSKFNEPRQNVTAQDKLNEIYAHRAAGDEKGAQELEILYGIRQREQNSPLSSLGIGGAPAQLPPQAMPPQRWGGSYSVPYMNEMDRGDPLNIY